MGHQKPDDKLVLLCDIARAGSLQEIADLAFQLFGNPIFIADLSHTILAYTKSVEIHDKDWQERIVHGELLPNSPQQFTEVAALHKKSAKDRFPILTEDSEVPQPRLVKTLVLNNQQIGVIVLTAIIRPFEASDPLLLELLSVSVLQQAERTQYRFLPSEKAVENFIIKLLNGESFPPGQTQKRLKILGWEPLQHLCVMVIRPDDKHEEGESPDLVLMRLAELPYCRAFIFDDAIVLIYSRGDPVSDWQTDEPELCSLLSNWGVLAGVSRFFQDLAYVRNYYLEAITALRLGSILDKHQFLYSYNRYSLYHLLEIVPSGTDLRGFCHDKILKLEKYDNLHSGNLLTTLQLYLELGHSLTKAAEYLYVHRNTVRYRINKCMEIMKTNFQDSNEVFSLVLSLRIIEFEKNGNPLPPRGIKAS